LLEKITKGENAIIVGVRQVRLPLPNSDEQVWPDSGRTPPDPVRSGQILAILARSVAGSVQISGRIRPDLAGSHPFWPNSVGSVQIRLDSSYFSQIRSAFDHGWMLASFGWNLVCRHLATVVGCRRIPAPAVFRSRLDSDN
jgi:hypothetical protein